MRRELSADNTGLILDGNPDERAPAWGKITYSVSEPKGRESYMGGGVYWCSHCASWRPFEEGCADAAERTTGPICDECWSRWVGLGMTGRWVEGDALCT
jgi:hypothetical protein